MFRAERPQAGRLRQFYQIGLEAIGAAGPVMDAEVITVLVRLLDEANVTDYRLKVNNLGCADDKKKLSKELKDAMSKGPAANLLCGDCRKRLGTNPLRTLDCKKESCAAAVRGAFKGVDFLCDGCKSHFDEVLRLLDRAGIGYAADPYIVRGLDYYTSTVFEVSQGSLGAQNAIAAGGRYDNLIGDIGGPATGACGFAIGLDRVMLALGDRGAAAGDSGTCVYIAAMGSPAVVEAFVLMDALRRSGVSCDMDYGARSLKSQMRSADETGAKYAVIIGDDELKKKEATVRNMETKEQSSVAFNEIVAVMRKKLTQC
jgi:histidyl-tRNA synthetase